MVEHARRVSAASSHYTTDGHYMHARFNILSHKSPKWLRLDVTTWRDSKQYVAGITTGNNAEIFIDKVAAWCLEAYIYEDVRKNVPELKHVIDTLDSNKNLSEQKEKLLLTQASKIISRVIYYSTGNCNGVKIAIHGRKRKEFCASHKYLKSVPESKIIKYLCDYLSEAVIHELIHASLFEYELSDLQNWLSQNRDVKNKDFVMPVDVHENTVCDLAIKIAGTDYIDRPRVV